MILSTLPPIHFPLTFQQVGALMDFVQKMNVVDAGVDPRTQKAADIEFHIYELLADTRGTRDYRGRDGHARLVQESMAFIPEQLVTKHGDLRAAHLAINYNNAQAKLKRHGFAPMTDNRDTLVNECRDLLAFPLGTEERVSLYLNYLAKKTA